MEGKETKTLVWTIGAQMIALAISLLVVFLIVWIASKAWKKGQQESGYLAYGGDWLDRQQESGYLAYGGDWLDRQQESGYLAYGGDWLDRQ